MKKLIEALEILSKYVADPNKVCTRFELNTITVHPIKIKDVSEEDKKLLDELGFYYWEPEEGFMSYSHCTGRF